MKKQFVTNEIALKLKELGFAEKCWFQYYKGNLDYCYIYEKKATDTPTIRTACLAPLWQQAIDWFRINHKIFIETPCIDNFYKHKNDSFHNVLVIRWEDKPYGRFNKILSQRIEYSNRENLEYGRLSYGYYQAREQAILKAIEVINEKR